jgi:hypothetical protein
MSLESIILYDSTTKRIDDGLKTMQVSLILSLKDVHFNDDLLPQLRPKTLSKQFITSFNEYIDGRNFMNSFYLFHSFKTSDYAFVHAFKMRIWKFWNENLHLEEHRCDFFWYEYRFDRNIIEGNPILGYIGDILTTMAGTILGFVNVSGFLLAGVGFANTANRIRIDKDVMSELLVHVKNDFEESTK